MSAAAGEDALRHGAGHGPPDVDAGNGAGGAHSLVASRIDAQRYRGHGKALFQAGGDQAENAGVPVLSRNHERAAPASGIVNQLLRFGGGLRPAALMRGPSTKPSA